MMIHASKRRRSDVRFTWGWELQFVSPRRALYGVSRRRLRFVGQPEMSTEAQAVSDYILALSILVGARCSLWAAAGASMARRWAITAIGLSRPTLTELFSPGIINVNRARVRDAADVAGIYAGSRLWF